jgi:hypothetical protein
MSNEKIIHYTKTFMKQKEISGRNELEKADRSLYEILRRRKLLDKIGFKPKLREWKSMYDSELIKYAKIFMKKKGITRRCELTKADYGLFGALRNRGLIECVFSEIQSKQEQLQAGLQQAADAMEQFGDSE